VAGRIRAPEARPRDVEVPEALLGMASDEAVFMTFAFGAAFIAIVYQSLTYLPPHPDSTARVQGDSAAASRIEAPEARPRDIDVPEALLGMASDEAVFMTFAFGVDFIAIVYQSLTYLPPPPDSIATICSPYFYEIATRVPGGHADRFKSDRVILSRLRRTNWRDSANTFGADPTAILPSRPPVGAIRGIRSDETYQLRDSS
jgi:hypothetical protein